MAHLSTSVGDADVAARVTLLRELASEEIVELGLEDTVGDELALFADLARHFEGAIAESKYKYEHPSDIGYPE